MIERVIDLPDNVLGFRAIGEVTADDYQKMLVPTVEEMLSKQTRVRLLYVIGKDFKRFTGGAAWEDAKIGMRHLSSWDRIAVVTDIDWIVNTVKALGFAFPCEIRVFDDDDLDDAREWISEPAPTGDLSFDLLRDQGVLVLRPGGELEVGDFERVAAEVDPYIEETGGLRGLMILANMFPGWDDFGALTSHLRFVRDHHKKIRRVAFVTDDRLLSALPRITRHFVAADVRAFPLEGKDEALSWVGES
jgi:hypothetical protein